MTSPFFTLLHCRALLMRLGVLGGSLLMAGCIAKENVVEPEERDEQVEASGDLCASLCNEVEAECGTTPSGCQSDCRDWVESCPDQGEAALSCYARSTIACSSNGGYSYPACEEDEFAWLDCLQGGACMAGPSDDFDVPQCCGAEDCRSDEACVIYDLNVLGNTCLPLCDDHGDCDTGCCYQTDDGGFCDPDPDECGPRGVAAACLGNEGCEDGVCLEGFYFCYGSCTSDDDCGRSVDGLQNRCVVDADDPDFSVCFPACASDEDCSWFEDAEGNLLICNTALGRCDFGSEL